MSRETHRRSINAINTYAWYKYVHMTDHFNGKKLYKFRFNELAWQRITIVSMHKTKKNMLQWNKIQF